MNKLTLLSSSLLTALLLASSNSALAKVPAGVELAPVQHYKAPLGQPNTIDPTHSSYETSMQVVRSLFDTLVRKDESGKLVPLAAQSWSVSADGLTWTFKLRPEAEWSDGQQVKAKDFLYAWKRLLDPQSKADYRNYLADAGVLNAREIVEGSKVLNEVGLEAPDDLTFVVKLAHPNPWFMEMTTNIVLSPLREDVVEHYRKRWTQAKHIVTNGPFKLENFSEEGIRLAKWNGYWGAKDVVITTVDYKFTDDVKTSYYNYLGGNYYIAEVPPSFRERVKEERPEELKSFYPLATEFYKINNKEIADSQLRLALSLLLDRNFMVERVIGSGRPTSRISPQAVTDGQLISQSPWFSESYLANVKQANSILEAKGFTYEKPFVVKITANKTPTQIKLANSYKQMLERNSNNAIQVEVVFVENENYIATIADGDYQLALSGWVADYDQVSTFFEMFKCHSSLNDLGYCNPALDNLLQQAMLTNDAEKRAKLYQQANYVLITQDNAVIPFYADEHEFLVSPALGGYNVNNSIHYVRDFYIIKDAQIKVIK